MDWHGKKIHFIGIGGIGMSGIAKMLLFQGAKVTGSDIRESEKTVELQHLGAEVKVGPHDAANIGPDVGHVVISAAIKPNNIEIREARRYGIKVLKYAQMVGILMKKMTGIAVSGTHGKTTTTAMIASILTEGGRDPSQRLPAVRRHDLGDINVDRFFDQQCAGTTLDGRRDKVVPIEIGSAQRREQRSGSHLPGVVHDIRHGDQAITNDLGLSRCCQVAGRHGGLAHSFPPMG